MLGFFLFTFFFKGFTLIICVTGYRDNPLSNHWHIEHVMKGIQFSLLAIDTISWNSWQDHNVVMSSWIIILHNWIERIYLTKIVTTLKVLRFYIDTVETLNWCCAHFSYWCASQIQKLYIRWKIWDYFQVFTAMKIQIKQVFKGLNRWG